MQLRFPVLFFLTTALLSTARLPAQTPVWSQLPGSPTTLLLNGNTPRDDDNHFVDPLHGWVARAADGIYRTTNGGLTFERVYSSTNAFSGTNLVAHFRSINFASLTRGWAGNLGPGSYDTSITDTNMLYETFDGGDHWAPVADINNSGMKGFCAIHVKDTQHIYGAGRVRGPAYFAKSEDGGASWWVTNLTAGGVMGGLMDVYFKDANTGFIVGMDTNAYNATCTPPYYHGAIARTTNGGLSWEVVASTPINCSYFWKMSWPSANVGYASLQQNSSESTIVFFKTTDGGATWSSNGIPHTSIGVSAGTTWFLQGIGFPTENEGWMGGSTSTALTLNQCFIHTIDGGLNWTPEGYNNTRGMNRIRFLNPTLGFASGTRVHVFRVPIAVSTQPTNQSVLVGTGTSFSVGAQGTAPLSYQWRFNATNALGANTNVFSIASAQFTNAGNYNVVISDYTGSVTSEVATLTVNAAPVFPSIVTQPQSLTVVADQDATFSVTATGSGLLSYQWRFAGTNISGATQTAFTRLHALAADAGDYTVVVTNNVGSVTSAVATLTVVNPTVFFSDNFDSYPAITVTTAPVTNAYKIFFPPTFSATDFKAILGYDYAAVTYPTNIPPAPHSTGTTKGLFLTVNKDGNPQAAAVNLYPTNQFFSNNFALKFDLWINWRDPLTSTEHTLFGINHSGNLTNRIGIAPSDGLYFAVTGEGDLAPTASPRDYSIYRGAGNAAPVLMTTNNSTFGPAPLLGAQFDNGDPGFTALFPAQPIPGYGTTPAGTAGLKWLRAEVRQVNNQVTWLLNDTIIAQYQNAFADTNGNIMLGYNDNFGSTGDSNNFAVIDNVRVESIVTLPVHIQTAVLASNDFRFTFATEAYESYTVESATNLAAPVWQTYTNFLGAGVPAAVTVPLLSEGQRFYRVRRP